ncbi:MAG TPA: AAA domain-containing protein, partial [Flavisolibacter sp.]|nr:AAA domain-containing protein [Flavisolibacter sp.]
MDYFKTLGELLKLEKEEDSRLYEEVTAHMPVSERRANGMSWYPVAIKDTEVGRGDYLTIELERTSHHDILHQFRFGQSAALFSNHNAKQDRVEGTITYVGNNRLKISLRIDELPDWTRDGKLGVDLVFDVNSYTEMENALKLAPVIAEKKEEGQLVRIVTGKWPLTFTKDSPSFKENRLNAQQQEAVRLITGAQELAIVHGPPGTGKTTTLVQAIKAMWKADQEKILVVAPSNAAVDLLSEKLAAEGLSVVRVGNPSRVSEQQVALTLDHKMANHASHKEIRRLKKQAAEYRDLAQKYKRQFGKEEREQRKALFTEARNISKEVERLEQYITQDILSRAQVITATLVGSNHYSVRHLRYHTVVIDEAGQALEPACWIPILKARKLVMAGDHNQLPPTIKSQQAAKQGLACTLMEKLVARYPEAVVLLEEQYRMHQFIMQYSSGVFYENRLIAHASVAGHLLYPGDEPLVFIDTAGCGFEEKWEGTSISNPEEADFMLKQVAALIRSFRENAADQALPTIGMIAPYKHQVELLKERQLQHEEIRSAASHVAVNTIDSFQGQERDV